jgi:hypothetical protein
MFEAPVLSVMGNVAMKDDVAAPPLPVEEMVTGDEPKIVKAEHVVFPLQDAVVVAVVCTWPKLPR